MSDNSHQSELILMGTGTSVGVPVVGCDCAVCQSGEEKNQRTRSGVLVKAPEGDFVIDTGPELRVQLLRSQATMIRAALFTHAHADHIMGLDDLRIVGFRLEKELMQQAEQEAREEGHEFDEQKFRRRGAGRIPLYCEGAVEDSIRHVFHYAFADASTLSHRYAAPKLKFERIRAGTPFSVLGLNVLPLRVRHGQMPIVGYRLGDVAFLTDVSTIPQDTRDQLYGLDTLIIDALRYDPHPTHLNVSQALKWIDRLQPRQAYLTHMSHDLDYETLHQDLPDHVEPAYDGLRIPLAKSS